MRRLIALVCLTTLVCLAGFRATASDLGGMLPMLKQGGYVLVLRHVATDDGQKDVYPFVFDDMKKQRQLSEEGRKVAREMGAAMKTLGVPLGQIYTSKLNRAVETGALVSGKGTTAVTELTDSSAGVASNMTNPKGGNIKIRNAIQSLVNKAPASGTNNVLVTHKTNITDAFGKDFSDVKEGEILIYKPDPSGPPTFVGRVKANEWTAQASSLKP